MVPSVVVGVAAESNYLLCCTLSGGDYSVWGRKRRYLTACDWLSCPRGAHP